ncbi:carboxymuconolactone decarboxylase family protein [Paractinoplanes atraurantiacus]|uniref:Alkylhydroperoxidase AhpD family core domain-containing protein n=1 Tax=Paractinoplanes atraurantiacus TaxID=1036182 RepID=A0A285K5P8_9ACTN|nr:carboxymuconolactone decarboxylase family protein [Actinoplanes atraurantiacus]SNY66816.1 alkylhydroperoxidase AhpD family core domain-containing protein [Actinoplanes atraurantiacus]
MPHIDLPQLPGMAGLLAGYPDTAGALNSLAETLLRGPSPLTPAQRENIAAHVSRGNECTFCAETHGAVARHLAGPGGADEQTELMAALLALAGKVRISGREVSGDDVERARAAGADDRMVHDTVLIAAAFSMFNRYVDGLGTLTPKEPAHYERHAGFLAANGYLRPPG